MLHILVLALLPFIAGGCAAIGVAANAVAGGENTPAEHTLAKKPTIVIAENFSNPSQAIINDEPLARYITDDLRKHEMHTLIDPTIAYDKLESDPVAWHKLSIAAAGRSVGAEQVVYIDIVELNVEHRTDAGSIQAHAKVLVRVVDCANGATIWPHQQADGYPLSVETKMQRDIDAGGAEGAVRAALLQNLSMRIAALFYPVHKD